MELREYQVKALADIRGRLKHDQRPLVVCGPTGSGKTVLAADIIKAAGVRTAFVCDRVVLIDQTIKALQQYGLDDIGVRQGENTRHTWAGIQVCTAQTLERRDSWLNEWGLVIVDECHVNHRKLNRMIHDLKEKNPNSWVIGMSASPLARDMASTWKGLITYSTTNDLLKKGYLAPLKIYDAKAQVNMKGAKLHKGEWSSKEAGKRASKITADIVSEWDEKCHLNFGKWVPTVVYTGTVDHGAQLIEEFNSIGAVFKQVSYRTEHKVDQDKNIQALADGEIDGLVNCDVLTRGCDFPWLKCIVMARPYHGSLMQVIQILGRLMRIYPGKDYGLVLDHVGNWLGHENSLLHYFEHGPGELSDLKKVAAKKRQKIKRTRKCRKCDYVFLQIPEDNRCPECGTERGTRQVDEVLTNDGVLVHVRDLLPIETKQVQPIKAGAHSWASICSLALLEHRQDGHKALKLAAATYRAIFNEWPQPYRLMPAKIIDPDVAVQFRKNRSRWRKNNRGKRKAKTQG